MTVSNNIALDELGVKLTQLSIEFLRYIKINYDQGNHLYIADLMDYFNYSNHQVVSKYLDKLEDYQLIESHFEEGKRVINITPKGLDVIYTLISSYLSEPERMWIEKLRSGENFKDARDQDDRIKDVILREFGRDIVPISSLNNICKNIRQIRFESSKDSNGNYENKDALS